jgi:signal peptidase II
VNECPASESSSQTNSCRAWKSGLAQFLFWLITLFIIAFDLISKWWAFNFIKEGEAVPVIPKFLYFQITKNIGAVFGMGKGMRWFFILASIFALVFVLQLFSKSRKNQHVFHFFLSLTLGGAIGNLYDRSLFGYVRDFIHLQILAGGKELWPWIFNIADVALVVGVSGLLLGWILGKFDMGGETTRRVARPVPQDEIAGDSPAKPD